MNCCQCQGIEKLFDERHAQRELRDYRAHGPARETRILLDALQARNVRGLTLLDIGGGVGAIQHELLKIGAARAVNVDASRAFLGAARAEAEQQGHAARIAFHHGNFVDVAREIADADIVTLDRVICCYHDMQSLVALSAERALKFYGLIFPKDTWWIKLGHPLLNAGLWLERNPMQTFIHATRTVNEVCESKGLRRIFQRNTMFWQVWVYAR